MFADSLLDNPWNSRARRGWATVVSFALEALAAGALLCLPMIFTEGLPQLHLATHDLLAAPAAPAQAAYARQQRGNTAFRTGLAHPLLIPAGIPSPLPSSESNESALPAPDFAAALSIPPAVRAGGGPGSVWEAVGNDVNLAAPPPTLPGSYAAFVTYG